MKKPKSQAAKMAQVRMIVWHQKQGDVFMYTKSIDDLGFCSVRTLVWWKGGKDEQIRVQNRDEFNMILKMMEEITGVSFGPITHADSEGRVIYYRWDTPEIIRRNELERIREMN